MMEDGWVRHNESIPLRFSQDRHQSDSLMVKNQRLRMMPDRTFLAQCAAWQEPVTQQGEILVQAHRHFSEEERPHESLLSILPNKDRCECLLDSRLRSSPFSSLTGERSRETHGKVCARLDVSNLSIYLDRGSAGWRCQRNDQCSEAHASNLFPSLMQRMSGLRRRGYLCT